LVEISPHAEPPVCKILDYGKYKFQAQKRKAEAKKKQKITELKEIKIRPGIEENDYQIKLRKMKEFLGDENKVKVTLRFRGREMSHREFGIQLLKRISADLEELCKIEAAAKLEGRQMVMVLGPK